MYIFFPTFSGADFHNGVESHAVAANDTDCANTLVQEVTLHVSHPINNDREG